MASRWHRFAQAPVASPQGTFHLFPNLPSEIRSKIWEASLTSRLIKCKWDASKNKKNMFSGPPTPIALLSVSREARENAFLYGKYVLVPACDPEVVYFSPVLDYLWIEAGWKPHVPTEPIFHIQFIEGLPLDPNHDYTKSLSKEIMEARNVMTGPNWSNTRAMPTVTFSDFPKLERILVAADECSVGNQSKVSRDTIYDLKMHYHHSNKERAEGQEVVVPEIAIGCLGRVGEEKRNIHHMFNDNRQLLHIFNTDSEMQDHQQRVREAAFSFTQQQRDSSQVRNALIAKLQKARELSELNKKKSNTYSCPLKQDPDVAEMHEMFAKLSSGPPITDRAPEYEGIDSQMDRNDLPPYAAPCSGGFSL